MNLYFSAEDLVYCFLCSLLIYNQVVSRSNYGNLLNTEDIFDYLCFSHIGAKKKQILSLWLI